MGKAKRNEPELLDGADLEQDCRPPAGEAVIEDIAAKSGAPPLTPSGMAAAEPPDGADDDDGEEDLPTHVTWLNVPTPLADEGRAIAGWRPRRARWSVALERVALAVERLVNRLTGPQYNPLYHTGTIAFLLLIVIGLTGLYLFFFFQYGYDASYNAVGRMESQFIARAIRAIHRYASGAAVIVTLLHAYRTLFLEKFRGPRWLAWLTGVALTAIIWFAGITGYWLIWDERALLITDAFRRALAALTPWNAAFMVFLTGAGEAGRSWVFFLVVLAAHVILFLTALGFFYLHIRRLARPKWLPPTHWVVGIGVIFLLAALFFPVGMLNQANLSRLPESIAFDPIFLFFLPFPGAVWLWLGLLVVAVAAAALPWLSRSVKRPKPVAAGSRAPASVSSFPPAHPLAPRVRILKDRCTGCTKCALDCPYGAIEMVERHDGKPHKYIALENVDRCVSCGICVGSCDALAVALGETMPENLWALVAAGGALPLPAPRPGGSDGEAMAVDSARVRGARVIFTCERHAAHGARPYLTGVKADDPKDVVIVLPCVGAAPPDLISRTLDAGAAAVRVVGCPPDDCANREGNLWTALRLSRQRVPRLRKPYADAPVTAAWLPPDAFSAALALPIPPGENGEADYAATRHILADFSWRNFLPALALLALALLAQILLTDLPLRPYADRPAVVQLVTDDLGATFGGLAADQLTDPTYALRLTVDGEEAMTEVSPAAELVGAAGDRRRHAYFHELPLSPGTHDLRLQLIGEETGTTYTLFAGAISAVAGEVVRPSLAVERDIPCSFAPRPERQRPCAR